MAHAYKLPSGLWRCWFIRYDGERKFFTLGKGATKREVETTAARLTVQHTQMRLGLLPRPDEHGALMRPIGDVIAEYLAWGQSQGSAGGRPWTAKHLRDRTKQLQQWQAEDSVSRRSGSVRVSSRVSSRSSGRRRPGDSRARPASTSVPRSWRFSPGARSAPICPAIRSRLSPLSMSRTRGSGAR